MCCREPLSGVVKSLVCLFLQRGPKIIVRLNFPMAMALIQVAWYCHKIIVFTNLYLLFKVNHLQKQVGNLHLEMPVTFQFFGLA